MLFGELDLTCQWYVAFKCASCTWGGMVALPEALQDTAIRQFLACPVHGLEPTWIKVLDTGKAKRSKRRDAAD